MPRSAQELLRDARPPTSLLLQTALALARTGVLLGVGCD
jgi:hypothetical protein